MVGASAVPELLVIQTPKSWRDPVAAPILHPLAGRRFFALPTRYENGRKPESSNAFDAAGDYRTNG
jgi:hypothetical protein